MSYTPKEDLDMTGDPTAPTATPTDDDTSVATTAFVQDVVALAASRLERRSWFGI